jgi:pyrophosphate--fructose-6-phosphate 1-phosphotransferase
VGVVFSGRQSPGGHNVVWGLHDALKAHNPHSVLYGFIGNLLLPKSQLPDSFYLFIYSSLCLRIGGTEGLFSNKTLEITNDVLASYKNQGWHNIYLRFILDILLSVDLHSS